MIKLIVSRNDNNNNNNQYDSDNRNVDVAMPIYDARNAATLCGSLIALSISLSIQDEKFDNQSVRCYCVAKIFRIKFRGIENIKILEKKKEEKCHI